ncbi:UDP-3-O-[3-hydroxymyristoyl] glucosamine N-acyltransferase [Nitritalea halalkaliphila LW7]|uniref:UDP-3-O-acylglucosamine N-acyltransferase n=1 Tax=Nitritalea halalkaliphila LW7 TaxID=1189621 RepID=I5C1H0_9BACT|nr:UDP-3-O-(3-hydroxymyristoyl)glucosamine N-acyltransferase [Nitritalea halalkaliphila]EIM75672.1 UDP-3-O-[3-hydroxymyristoyl] glucosamine N-acyltransferase [Nitritalea halalkaliphila LW7]
MEFSLEQVAQLLNGSVEGDGSLKVSRLDKIQEGKPGGISFLANEKYVPYLYETEATAVIVSEDFAPQRKVNAALIRVKNAYTAFTDLLTAYEQLSQQELSGVEEPSYCGEGTQVGEGVYRAAFSYIGRNCSIGDGVKIYPHAYIGDGVKIGAGTIIRAGAKLCKEVIVGAYCDIHEGAVIGSDGFGFAPQDDGSYKAIPQIGQVILGDHVRIGANTTVDRATMGATRIEEGAKIDNLVQLAHNVVVGAHTVIAAQAGVSGSSTLGKNCVIAGQAGIVGHLNLADRTTVGASTGISKSVNKPGTTLFGYMGMDLKGFLKAYAIFKKLPELQEKVKELEKKA